MRSLESSVVAWQQVQQHILVAVKFVCFFLVHHNAGPRGICCEEPVCVCSDWPTSTAALKVLMNNELWCFPVFCSPATTPTAAHSKHACGSANWLSKWRDGWTLWTVLGNSSVPFCCLTGVAVVHLTQDDWVQILSSSQTPAPPGSARQPAPTPSTPRRPPWKRSGFLGCW